MKKKKRTRANWGKKNISPIARKIRELVQTEKMTYEKICVACDMKYQTLMNIFSRDKISDFTRKALKYGGLIDEKDEIEQIRWLNSR